MEQLDGPCIRCSGALSSRGYGQVWVDGQNMAAHRVMYILTFGAIPENIQVQHLCNNRWCVNPRHLTVGTHSDNAKYAVACGRWEHDQRFGRGNTAGKDLPKGISWDGVRHKYLVQIRVGDKRPRVRVNTLVEAIKARADMEAKYWGHPNA